MDRNIETMSLELIRKIAPTTVNEIINGYSIISYCSLVLLDNWRLVRILLTNLDFVKL